MIKKNEFYGKTMYEFHFWEQCYFSICLDKNGQTLTTVSPPPPFNFVDDFLVRRTKRNSTFFSLMATFFCARDSRRFYPSSSVSDCVCVCVCVCIYVCMCVLALKYYKFSNFSEIFLPLCKKWNICKTGNAVNLFAQGKKPFFQMLLRKIMFPDIIRLQSNS